MKKIFLASFFIWALSGFPRVSYREGLLWYCRYPNVLEVVGLKRLPIPKVYSVRRFYSEASY